MNKNFQLLAKQKIQNIPNTKVGPKRELGVFYTFGMPSNKKQEGFTLIRTTVTIFELLI